MTSSMIWKTRRHGIIWLIDGGLVTSILIVNERYVSTNKRMGKTTKILNEMILMDLHKSFLHFYGFSSQGHSCWIHWYLLVERIDIARKRVFWECKQSTWLSLKRLSCRQLFLQRLLYRQIKFSYRRINKGPQFSW